MLKLKIFVSEMFKTLIIQNKMIFSLFSTLYDWEVSLFLRFCCIFVLHLISFSLKVFLLYFYAALKKMDRDWISGYSMSGLSRKWIFDPFRPLLSSQQIDFYLVHCCGLVFELAQSFLLSFDKTRKIGR